MAEHEFRIDSESPVNKDLMFWRIVGHEGLSRPSSYELTVLSQDRTIDPRQILGHAFDVVIGFADADDQKHERHARGHAVRVVRGGQVGRFFEYRISLRSWFGLLTKRINSCILQDKPVLDVIDAVLTDSPIKAHAKTEPAGVIGVHEARRYCVQFQESDYNFLSRILEDEGVYYWFDSFDSPGVMHLADSTGMAHGPLPAKGVLNYAGDGASEARFNEIERWVSARQLRSGKYESRDVNYKAINTLLSTHGEMVPAHELADLEVFEYPGGFFTSEQSDVVLEVRAGELPARQTLHWAVTRWPDVAVGHTFTFKGDPDGTRDGDYLIGGCVFVATHPGYEGMGTFVAPRPTAELLREALRDDAVNAGCTDALLELIDTTPTLREGVRGTSAFLITALPADHIFRPPRLTPRVTMPGPQSAIVVGGKGKEHDVDPMGRVKVHFHWDRKDFQDDRSTCWIRVSQPWAGKNWGGYFAPRINQEVIVEFMNGDPDRPIVTGRVYNDDQQIPYKSATQSGFKTRSTPGGGPSNYNEIMFEDKRGAELVNIHAERNMATTVENDDSTHVMNDQSLTVDRHRTIMVKGKEEHTVMKTQMNHVVLTQTNKFDADTFTTTLGNQSVGTKGKQDTVVNGPVTSHTNNTYTLTSVGAFSQTSASVTVNSVGAVALTSGANIAVGSIAEMKMTTNADRIDASVGSHSIFANAIKAVSNSNLELLAVGNINATSNGSNTTVMGANSSGYIGVNSEANMGMARSTFMGLSIDTMMGLSMSSCLAVQMEAAAALKLGFSGFDLSQAGIDMEQDGIKVIMPGAPGATSGGAAALGASIGAAIGAIAYSAVAAYADISATNTQYKDAAKALEEAASQADKLGLHSMAKRLEAAMKIADARREKGWYNPDNMRLHSAPADDAAQYTGDGPTANPENAVAATRPSPGSPPPEMPVAPPAPPASRDLPVAPIPPAP
jgi:type VI secretion system secreted protein VgrG